MTSIPEHYLKNILYRTTDLHGHFIDKTVFVAGSTGFYGSWMLAFFEYLKSQGINVAVRGGSRRTGWNVMDDRTYTPFQHAADFIVNCAGSACAITNDELSVHHDGAVALYLSAPKARCLYISTGAIGADTPYSAAKSHAEYLLEGQGLDIQIVRPFATVGPGMPLNSHFAIAAFIRNASVGRALMVKPGIVRSFCHVADLIVQMLHVLTHGDGKPYEVGSDDPISLEDAANLISDQVMWSRADFPTNAAADRYIADLTRVKAHFNLDLTWTSSQSIMDTWQHFKSQPMSE